MSDARKPTKSGKTLWIVCILVAVLILAIVGGIVAWYLHTFERVEIEVPGRYSGMARVNPYYAAELFLEEMDIASESRFSLGELPPTDHVVLVLTRDTDSRHALQGKLYDWVASGGHLIIAAIAPRSTDEREQRDPDPLLAMAGLALRPTDEHPDVPYPGLLGTPPGTPDAGPPDAGERSGDRSSRRPPPTLFDLLGRHVNREVVTVSSPATTGPRTLQMNVDRDWTLVHRQDEEFMDSVDPIAVRPHLPVAYSPVAQGQVTAVVESYFMNNRAIGEHDHARLLHALVTQERTPAGAILIVRAQSDSFMGLIWRVGWMVILSLLALVLAWVWAASRRFGPVLPEPSPTRRRLMEHIEAMGTFLWRHGYHGELLDSAREAVRLKLAARLGGETNLEGTALEKAVADETGIRESRVHEAFYGGQPKDRRAFTQTMAELQRLWRER